MVIATGTAILGAAALGTAGVLYSSGKSSKAVRSAAATATQGTLEATKLQLDYLRETRADIAEAVDQGLIDLDTGFDMAISALDPGSYDAINEYVSLLKDPSAVMQRPGVQFQYRQGLDALQTGFSRTSGGGLSGDVVASAQQYGQNFASTALDAELARLAPLMNIQEGRIGNIAQLYTQKGATKSQLRVGGATGAGGIGASILPGIAGTTVAGANIAAQGITAGAGINAAAMGNITSTVSDLASLYALRPDLFSKMGGGAGAGSGPGTVY